MPQTYWPWERGASQGRPAPSTWIQSWSAATSERYTHIDKADGGAPVVRAKTQWAMIDFATSRPRRIPVEVREAFAFA
jgi:acyl-CoA thioesterase FadM